MKTTQEIKEAVKAKYNQIAIENKSCCDDDCELEFIGEKYDELEGHVSDADLGLGCGLPTKASRINKGDVVVDLGSGAGNDAFVARAVVGEEGRVIGIDMADSMIAKARTNAEKQAFNNVEFRLGDIEDVPLADNTADVVVSNCVFNLVPDKDRAFEETKRILKPGGHFAISDIVTVGDLPEGLRHEAALYVGCISGAIDKEDYLQIVRDAGYENISVSRIREIDLENGLIDKYLGPEKRQEFRDSNVGIFSMTIVGYKPDPTKADAGCCDPGCC